MWIFRDFESQAMQSGSEDPEVANVLQKCEEYVPGKVHFDSISDIANIIGVPGKVNFDW